MYLHDCVVCIDNNFCLNKELQRRAQTAASKKKTTIQLKAERGIHSEVGSSSFRKACFTAHFALRPELSTTPI